MALHVNVLASKSDQIQDIKKVVVAFQCNFPHQWCWTLNIGETEAKLGYI